MTLPPDDRELTALVDRRLLHEGSQHEVLVLRGTDALATMERLRTRSDVEIQRTLDRYALVVARGNRESLKRVEAALFDHIANVYDTVVNRSSNLRNINCLITRVGPGHLLDYGCGSGLSSVLTIPGVQVSGYDKSDRMIEIARERGLTVYSWKALRVLPDAHFDGMFASYVLHLTESLDHLPTAFSKIRSGGLFAANFHKGRGADAAKVRLGRHGFGAPIRDEDSEWGRRLTWRAKRHQG